MLRACGEAKPMLNPGDVVRAVVRKTAVFGLFCQYRRSPGAFERFTPETTPGVERGNSASATCLKRQLFGG